MNRIYFLVYRNIIQNEQKIHSTERGPCQTCHAECCTGQLRVYSYRHLREDAWNDSLCRGCLGGSWGVQAGSRDGRPRSVREWCVLTNALFSLQPICQAAYNNDFNEVQLLLDKNSNYLNIQDSFGGDTPLICACKQGNNRIANYLLKKNADVNLRNKVSGHWLSLCTDCSFEYMFGNTGSTAKP